MNAAYSMMKWQTVFERSSAFMSASSEGLYRKLFVTLRSKENGCGML